MPAREHHVMVDLETLSLSANAVFFAIAAVPFDPETATLGPPFFVLVDPTEAHRQGGHLDPGTVAWWERQSPEARAYLTAADEEGLELTTALARFEAYLASLGPADDLRLWGKGADFDKAILDATYHRLGRPVPWGPRAARCYRTLEALSPTPVPGRTLTGLAHHALDDATHQATQAIAILRRLAGAPECQHPPESNPDRSWVSDPLEATTAAAKKRVRP